MFEDKYKREIDEKKHWKVIDTITHEDGTKEVREYYNTVVDDCSKLIACLIKGQAGYKGVSFWAVGAGLETWADENPPNPDVADTKLLNEVFRKEVNKGDVLFLDKVDKPTTDVTNKIQISVTFAEGEANGALREFSLYGGNASKAKDSWLMINRKTHGLIYKTSGMILNRVIRVIF